jgi:nitrogen fixation-related uncharacterized protein
VCTCAPEWILPTVIVTTFLAYFGETGPQPTLPSGVDALLVVVIGLLSYVWAVRSGYLTEELEDILRHHHEQEKKAPATRLADWCSRCACRVVR